MELEISLMVSFRLFLVEWFSFIELLLAAMLSELSCSDKARRATFGRSLQQLSRDKVDSSSCVSRRDKISYADEIPAAKCLWGSSALSWICPGHSSS